MKKFVFTLEAVARYKDTVEKKQKSELSRVNALLNALYAERTGLLNAIDECAASLVRALEENRDIRAEMERHDLYQLFLHDHLEEVEKRIEQAETEKKRIQALLIITMKEQKTLARLRQEQYQAYLEEVRQEEEKLISDLVAYNSAAGEPEYAE